MNSRETSQRKTFDLFQFLYKYGTLLTILILIIVFAYSNPAFIQSNNLINILRSISIVTIIAIGITISLSVNGFDLSVGSVASLSNAVVISMFVWFSQNTTVAIFSAIIAALLVGAFNAL
ncbi:ribose transport system [Halalkalibacter akibai JCM 9157]|uniref:Ribose transport system n=1 Tax=Halalkalibacter akibai (strain ATCC 43226 / DSM 21942 / CIP 109018 / JCM 9157 / 1139) TaxID=1236973 RepID=W4R0G9_HALA3|nr:ribose transport system [Halalkalibacter akibai JCM 9157]